MSLLQPKVGIICGRGHLPQQIVAYCQQHQIPYHVLAVKGQADEPFINDHPHHWVALGQMGLSLEFLREAEVKRVVMAGYFQRPSWSQIRPDKLGAIWMAQIVGRIFGDDALLTFLVKKIEAEGFEVISSESLMGGSVLACKGIMGSLRPSDAVLKTIEHGFKVAKKLGEADIGQSVIVQEGIVLAVEAIEGTDALMRRSVSLQSSGERPILVKVLKPQQDGRVDRPTIGLETIKIAADCGLQGIVVEAGEVIILDAGAVVRQADEVGIFLLGW